MKIKKKHYHKVNPGEKVILRVNPAGTALWCIKCCDCGLEHVVLMRPTSKQITVAAFRYDDVAKIAFPKEHVTIVDSRTLPKKPRNRKWHGKS